VMQTHRLFQKMASTDKDSAMKHFERELVIRKASKHRADKIHDILKQAFKGLEGRGYSTQAIETAIVDTNEIRKRMHLGGHVLVAELDNEIIGTVTGLEEHKSMYVCSLAVDPKYQNYGVAHKLMNYLERIAHDKGCYKLFLCTAWAMKEAIRLYESLGYVKEGYLHKHFCGEDFIIFGKLIKENTMDYTQEVRK
jgi:ribosomal protein S18 acetylase RimI-like enzyme